MNHYIRLCLFIVLGGATLLSCSKQQDNPAPGAEGGYASLGNGTIYYDWATDGILKFSLATATVSTAQQDDLSRNGWDISIDGTRYLQAEDKSGGGYDTEIYTLTNLSNGTIISQFEKQSGYANHTFPKLSQDAQLIAVPPTYDDGLMILNLQGQILHNLTSFQGIEIDKGNVNWMPDNTVIFSTGNKICRSNQAFTQASVIKTLNFAAWNDLTVSRDGSRMAFAASNHIWTMNADGSDLRQVTSSSQVEVTPEFSPDGKWLLLGTDYHTTGPFGHIWRLVIIPANGNQYNVDEGADPNVIPLIRQGETLPEACDGGLLWR
ncbi:TolB-like translocation protein [Taibaiella koreensis]|uniref:PD40 domain-containing protein n=1 Tax=Taibaiella koreensis TaxID=1268548 RepID=UPI000E59A176|nr:PD40 domain-containing protein [Taibaiella koreensis]